MCDMSVSKCIDVLFCAFLICGMALDLNRTAMTKLDASQRFLREVMKCEEKTDVCERERERSERACSHTQTHAR